MTISLSLEMEKTLQEEAVRQGKTPETLAMEALLAGLKNRRVPQLLEELGPCASLPPGKTLHTVIEEFNAQYPSEETDEQVDRLLEELS